MFSIDNMKISAGQKCMRREGVLCESYLEVVCMTVNIPGTKLRKVKMFVRGTAWLERCRISEKSFEPRLRI
jgi:phosphoribosyl-dephospho-CoA transferase